MSMSKEQIEVALATYAEAFVQEDGRRIVGLHDRPVVAFAHENAVRAVINQVAQTAAEEMRERAAKVCDLYELAELSADDSANAIHSARPYRKCATAIRALIKEEK